MVAADDDTSPVATGYRYPYNDIVYLAVTRGGGPIRGSGAIIGPHTILTASHVVWESPTQTAASAIGIYPGYADNAVSPEVNGTPLAGSWRIHYNPISYSYTSLAPGQAASDFAIIDVSATFTSWFGVSTSFAGGTVHGGGYPAHHDGNTSAPTDYGQWDPTGTVSIDPSLPLLDFGTLVTHPGDSGGPLWFDIGTPTHPLPYVAGVASTSEYGPRLTEADWQQISGWIASDAGLWAASPPPPPASLSFASVDRLDFDAGYYLASNHDVAVAVEAGAITATDHFHGTGWKEGRNPDQLFNTAYYLAHNPDVAAAGIDPLVHFAQNGWREGRDPSAGFSVAAYERLNPDVASAGIDPLWHYLNFGYREGRRIA